MVKVSLSGFDEFYKALQAAPAELIKEVDHEVQDAADLFAKNAKRDAPVDEGQLRNEISSLKIQPLSAKVISVAAHSAYVEWGTITKVSVPADLSQYAAQFKGKGIKKTGGMKPRPFFFVQIPFVQQRLVENVRAVLGDLLKGKQGPK